jgi:hypothetical protein
MVSLCKLGTTVPRISFYGWKRALKGAAELETVLPICPKVEMQIGVIFLETI